jgi:hypothetical protein
LKIGFLVSKNVQILIFFELSGDWYKEEYETTFLFMKAKFSVTVVVLIGIFPVCIHMTQAISLHLEGKVSIIIPLCVLV